MDGSSLGLEDMLQHYNSWQSSSATGYFCLSQTSSKKLRVYLIHSQSYDRLKNCLIFPIGAIVFFFEFF